MRVADLLGGHTPTFSFEFSPPRTEVGLQKLFATVEHLAELNPNFVSVTYGAGGSTQGKTVEIASRIKSTTGIEPIAHLTCRGHSKSEIDDILLRLEDNGIENVLALRGDPPRNELESSVSTDFQHADSLVSHIRKRDSFCIGVAGYPEVHPESKNADDDLARLVHKVKTGADFITTQLFFENATYFDFVRKVRSQGISVPVIPGIMPITNVAQIKKMTEMCGATIPQPLLTKLERFSEDNQAVMAIGIEWAIKQCRELLALGAPGIHFYTMNRSLATRVICVSLQRFKE